MKRYVYLLDLKDDAKLQEEYLKHHQNVWACVERRLGEIGLLKNSIYRCGSRLVNVLETVDSFDPQKDLTAYAEDPECRRWDDLMRTFQQKVPAAKEGEWWALCGEVYDYPKK